MKRNVPKLRFNGFDDEWKENKFGEVTKKTGPRNKKNEEFKVYSISNKHGFIPQEEQFDGSRLSSLDKSAYKIVTEGDFAYNPARINVGSIGLLESGTGIVSSLYVCFKFIKGLDNSFFKSYFSTYKFNKDVLRNVEGGVREYLFYENFSNIKFKLPSLQEQEKIANFLTKVDSLIEEQDGKVKDLELYKKGMMQKIFSQEIRFKDDNGCEYPKWEEKKLGKFIVEYTEKTIANNQYPVLTSSRNGLMLQSDYFKDRQVTTDDNTGYFVLPYGYITFRSRSDDGIFVFNQNLIIEKGIISYFYPVFTFNKDLNNYYGITYMNNYLKKEILKEVVGTSQLVLSLNKLKNLKIKLPCLEEQTKIANFLSNIDSIIEEENNKLEDLRQWKKGLLQQMFV